jgi:hypothetical protein
MKSQIAAEIWSLDAEETSEVGFEVRFALKLIHPVGQGEFCCG